MNKEQKRFKIQKIYSYQKELKKENRKIIFETFLLGFCALGIMTSILCFSINNPIIQTIHTIPSVYGSISMIKYIINSIMNKTVMQYDIDELEKQLEMYEILENNPKSEKIETTNAQKRFKICKKNSYEEETNKEKRKATLHAFALGASSLATIFCCKFIYEIYAKSIICTDKAMLITWISAIIGAPFFTIVSTIELKNLMNKIIHKTMLEMQTKEINTELKSLGIESENSQIIDTEEERGMTR